MNFVSLSIGELLPQVAQLSRSKFSGKISIGIADVADELEWYIYFNLGRVVWANGGLHPVRRWLRLIQHHTGGADLQISVRDKDKFAVFEYHCLCIAFKRSLVDIQAVQRIIYEACVQVFFDIYQRSAITSGLDFQFQIFGGLRPSEQEILPIQSVIDLEPAIAAARLEWQQWVSSGLVNILVDAAPRIKKPQELQQSLAPNIYRNLQKVIDGDRSFRDISQVLNVDLFKLVKVLSPYIHKQMINLEKISDKTIPILSNSPPEKLTKTNAELDKVQLISCIDDDPQICRMMEQIVKKAGYSFMGITDSVKALAMLLEAKPEIIFLDLIMPVANGYEICAQIRRISCFNKTPIIILSGNDGLVDRVRAKVAGASDFLTKPAPPDKLIALIEKYLKQGTS